MRKIACVSKRSIEDDLLICKDIFDRTSWNTNEWVDDGYEFRSTNRRQTQAGMLETDATTSMAVQLDNMLQTLVLQTQGKSVAATNAVHAMNPTASVDCPQCGVGHL